MSIMEYNGGSVIAMKGKDCVAIATDTRLGSQALTVACNFDKVFPVTEKTYIGLAGLGSDVSTLKAKFRYRMKIYEMKEERVMEPETFAHLVSSTLYERRFGSYFVEPVIAGINSKSEPFIAGADLIGCLNYAKDVVVAGTASDKLYGMAEGLWEPDMDEEQLFECISQSLLGALERDALSGWGAIVRVITPTKVIERQLKARMD
ncbi:unnamed protein product [Parajaminaea phylloscopi]